MASLSANADDQNITTLRHFGPIPVMKPAMLDSIDVNSKSYLTSDLLNATIDMDIVERGDTVGNAVVLSSDNSAALHLVGFTISNTAKTSAYFTLSGAKQSYNIYVDGKQISGGYTALQPAVHKVVVKYLTQAGTSDTLSISVDADKTVIGDIGKGCKRTLTVNDVLELKQYSSARVSPDGRFLISSTYHLSPDGKENRKNHLWNISSASMHNTDGIKWMPRTNKYLVTRSNATKPGYTLVAVDPLTLQETILTESLPKSTFTMSPTEDFVIYEESQEGPKEAKDVYEVITPDDRQPGWRNRTNIYKFDLKTGLVQQLTFGHHNISLADISQDGKSALFFKNEHDASKMRPTDFVSIYHMNLDNLEVTKIVSNDGFISNASFSPDAKQILVCGSPECLGGVGNVVPEGMTPNTYDNQLYIINIDNPSAITPLTKAFNPSVSSFEWSEADGQIYFSAEHKDSVCLYRINPKTQKIQYIPLPEEMIGRWSIASRGGTIAWYGQSAQNASRLYSLNTKTLKSTLLEDLCKDKLDNIDLGECHPFVWVNPEGDSICCRYYLPPHFDPSKQYPMIVNYYGGCSPTSRSFGGRYSAHAYTALGYVMLIVNPRGATGFGQKWSAAHVNTAGKGVAEDIIGATKAFTAQHNFINDKKIGCIGASYGGFMTQYLQTVTDIFAAAVSHAGISDHTSYWGEGYWGYSYSQVSMANSYPWTRKDLFVDQSPLFNADKIHTPLLFVHGASDTNVPVGESIQMYTALKLLNRPTALVLVDGENHWILQYQKFVKWQNTIWAWFAKYLQDDPSWWKEMYGDKAL